MAEEGSLLRGCAAGAEAWRAGLGCKDPQSEAGERHRQTHLQMHTHILMQHREARPGAVGSESSRAKLQELTSKRAGLE